MAEGLLPAVKVFLDWLRTNPDLIIVCAQVFTHILHGQGPQGWKGDEIRRSLGSLSVVCQEPDWPGRSGGDLFPQRTHVQRVERKLPVLLHFPKADLIADIVGNVGGQTQ